MTQWFCDRCGTQVSRNSNGTTKYQILKKCIESDPITGSTRMFERNIKLCDQCAVEMEQFLNDEFNKIPTTLTGICDRRV